MIKATSPAIAYLIRTDYDIWEPGKIIPAHKAGYHWVEVEHLPRRRKYTMRQLAAKYEVALSTVVKIIHCRRRADRHTRRVLLADKAERERKSLFKKVQVNKTKPEQFRAARRTKPARTEEELKVYFLNQVIKSDDPTACQLHPAHTFYWLGQPRQVHRIAAEIAGLLPDPTLPVYIKHTCHQLRCCNPAHLSVQRVKRIRTGPRLRRQIKQEELDAIRKYYKDAFDKQELNEDTHRAVCQIWRLYPDFLEKIRKLPVIDINKPVQL